MDKFQGVGFGYEQRYKLRQYVKDQSVQTFKTLCQQKGQKFNLNSATTKSEVYYWIFGTNNRYYFLFKNQDTRVLKC